MLAQFRHPNIVQVYQVIEAFGTAYMVMEYVEGRTLQAEVEARGTAVGGSGAGSSAVADRGAVGGGTGRVFCTVTSSRRT